jgi:hypothetical protein
MFPESPVEAVKRHGVPAPKGIQCRQSLTVPSLAGGVTARASASDVQEPSYDSIQRDAHQQRVCAKEQHDENGSRSTGSPIETPLF